MFNEFSNQIWSVSPTGCVVSDNTDLSIDGSSKKIVFSEIGSYAVSTFDSAEVGTYEEVSMQLYFPGVIDQGNIFTIEINGKVCPFEKIARTSSGLNNGLGNGWNHVLFDCTGWPAITSFKITSLISNLIIFIDVAGYRKVDYETIDLDVTTAMKSAISLDYNVSTTLTENAKIGGNSVSLSSKAYVNNTSYIKITDGVNTEYRQLQTKGGNFEDPLLHSYNKDLTTVSIICPVLSEDYDEIEPNPVCGIKIYDQNSEYEDVPVHMKDVSTAGVKLKRFLGDLKVIIYVECSAKKKFWGLCRQFDDKYGESFNILLDGEVVTMYTENVVYSDTTDLGNIPRKAWFYSINPQPVTVTRKREIENFIINFESK